MPTDIEDLRVYENPRSPLLRRHVVHDRRSRAYPLPPDTPPDRRIMWERKGPVYDQNRYNEGRGVGACTACAGYGLLMTNPFFRGVKFDDRQVLDLYALETRLDESVFPGVWPPTDTGSSGLYLMQALRQLGLIDGYRHAFSLRAALAALWNGPIAVGSLWLDSMFEVRRGQVTVDPRSPSAGGHEYLITGYDPQGSGWVYLQNSWGEQWGRFGDGCAWLDVPSFAWLLAQHGDAVQPTVRPTHSR